MSLIPRNAFFRTCEDERKRSNRFAHISRKTDRFTDRASRSFHQLNARSVNGLTLISLTHLFTQILQRHSGVGGVDHAQPGLDDVVRQPLYERVGLVRSERALELQCNTTPTQKQPTQHTREVSTER